MTHPNKKKGNKYERELVKQAEERGLFAKRAYASDGRSLGEAKEVDVLIGDLRVQAKRRKKIAQYLKIPEGADVNIIREDYGDSLAIVPLDLLLNLIRHMPGGDDE